MQRQQQALASIVDVFLLDGLLDLVYSCMMSLFSSYPGYSPESNPFSLSFHMRSNRAFKPNDSKANNWAPIVDPALFSPSSSSLFLSSYCQ